jgi:DNA-3-methyladenine glycosylase II
VAFWSPYEAAAWAVIGQRIRIRQAAAVKAAMARQLGEPVSFGGHVVHAFPAPQRLASLLGYMWPLTSASAISGRITPQTQFAQFA